MTLVNTRDILMAGRQKYYLFARHSQYAALKTTRSSFVVLLPFIHPLGDADLVGKGQ